MRWVASSALFFLVLPPLSSQEKVPLHKTPGEAFVASIAAIRKMDWRAFARQTTKESQTGLAGGLILLGRMAFQGNPEPEKFKSVRALLMQHGITSEKLKDLDAKFEQALFDPKFDPKELPAALMELGKGVQNKPAFIADCAKALIATGILGEDPLEGVHEIKLGKIEINGSLAEAMVLPPQGKANRPAMIFFRLEDGSWRIDIARMIRERRL